MPLYDFACGRCGERFEQRVGVAERPSCPACGTPQAQRMLASFAGPFTTRPRGLAAKRSDATRRAREEQRRERRAQRSSGAQDGGAG